MRLCVEENCLESKLRGLGNPRLSGVTLQRRDATNAEKYLAYAAMELTGFPSVSDRRVGPDPIAVLKPGQVIDMPVMAGGPM